MRPTTIIYAHPETFRILAEDTRRFSGSRRSLPDRMFAAWLVFTGRADALSWETWPPQSDGAGQPPRDHRTQKSRPSGKLKRL